ncbi:hypothetical protein NIES2119_08150 [[Phormidium ambiguum] IAM M-71]|uniref:Uncharacterized protein n=1 Tax=[Phormidium ambiguum] IAM M-71 TaxID=454136 RepID=A0A1U7IP95_9CYAN|nr:hypothetical protein NIES2119_08150 [Phormidium ambiguum IAM M-71]
MKNLIYTKNKYICPKIWAIYEPFPLLVTLIKSTLQKRVLNMWNSPKKIIVNYLEPACASEQKYWCYNRRGFGGTIFPPT